MVVFPDLPGMTPISQISGDGGYGDVYLYEQHTPRRRVAVKVLRDQHLDDKVRRQFMSEADAMAQNASGCRRCCRSGSSSAAQSRRPTGQASFTTTSSQPTFL